MARVLGVSTSRYYAWLKRPRSAREKSDAALVERMRAIHKRSRGTYGALRIQAELAGDGVMDSSLATELVVGALEMAIAQRRPEDVIHRSDQGSQYTSLAFGKRCRDERIALDGFRRRLLRQRHGRDLLRQPRVRTARPDELPKSRRSEARTLPLDRGLVQPASAPLRHRTPLAHQLRKGLLRSRLNPKPKPSTKTGQLQIVAAFPEGEVAITNFSDVGD